MIFSFVLGELAIQGSIFVDIYIHTPKRKGRGKEKKRNKDKQVVIGLPEPLDTNLCPYWHWRNDYRMKRVGFKYVGLGPIYKTQPPKQFLIK